MHVDTGTSLDRLIEARRSIRKYKPEIPSTESVIALVKAAQKAPSPSNSQPVRFIRVMSPQVRQQLSDALNNGYAWFLEQQTQSDAGKRTRNWINAYFRFSDFMVHAPVLFAVGVKERFTGFTQEMINAGILKKDLRKDTDQDISVGLSVGHFLLKAKELGLGTCVLTAPLIFIDQSRPEKTVDKILGLTDIKIKCLITAGIPNENPVFPPKDDLNVFYREV